MIDSTQTPDTERTERRHLSEVPQPWRTLLRIPALFVRSLILIPVVATMVTSVVLMIYGAKETLHFIEVVFPHEGYPKTEHNQILYLGIEIVDLFLLATVVQVVSLGLYQLYFRQDLKLPEWLKIRNLDDLKSKLVSVVITMLGVLFLGEVLVWNEGQDIAYLGVGVAALVGALVYFLSKIKSEH